MKKRKIIVTISIFVFAMSVFGACKTKKSIVPCPGYGNIENNTDIYEVADNSVNTVKL